MFKFSELGKNNKTALLISLTAVPIVIYLYFLNWRTDVIYGDDLIMYTEHGKLNTLLDKINLLVPFQKYRPIHGLFMHLVMESFQKNLEAYYIFNIAIQTINTFLFALLANLFLKSPLISVFFGLIAGLSRFTFFNITQLLNGGPLEGIAMTLFLLSLFFVIRVLVKTDLIISEKRKGIWLGIFFATLAMYTHERYIVILPFIFLAIFIAPSLKSLVRREKILLAVCALFSMLLNFLIKKYIFLMPFFMGTGGVSMEFSFTSAMSYFIEAVLSIFQINSGPDYLVGVSFSNLSLFQKVSAIAVFASCVAILILFLYKTFKAFRLKQQENLKDFSTFFLLLILFGLFLVPAIVTIRLEQRWLQTSLDIFILMIVIALCNLNLKNIIVRNRLFALFIILFLYVDFTYLYRGAGNLYMSYSEKEAKDFHEAIQNGTIHPGTAKLYIWEKEKDINTENGIKWSLGEGYFFKFYQGKEKKLVFVDSIYERSYSFPISSFVNFDKNSEQIIYRQDKIFDITADFLQDSLRNFRANIMKVSAVKNVLNNQGSLMITTDDFNKFQTTGFYDNENGFRWTNGNASIEFPAGYNVSDSLMLVLNTYIPAICKNIVPKILMMDQGNKEYETSMVRREGDKFTFKQYFKVPAKIINIRIVSDTINASPDIRKLSFPFISLGLNNYEK